MKTVDEIKKEFEIYKPNNEKLVDNLEGFNMYLMIGIDDLDATEEDYKKEIKENNNWQLRAKIRNFFFFIFQEEEVDFYDEDNEILLELIKLSTEHRNLFKKIQETVTEDNYMDLFKLVEFSTIYYGDAIDYFDFKRDRLEMALKGLYMCNSRYEDNTAKFYEFAYEYIKKYEDNKEKEKSITNN